MRDGGKGDAKRPLTIPEEEFEANWDRIFLKTHYCKEEKTVISYVGECNWCGEKGETND